MAVATKVHVGQPVTGQGLPKSRAGSAQALLSSTSTWGSSLLHQCLWFGGRIFSPFLLCPAFGPEVLSTAHGEEGAVSCGWAELQLCCKPVLAKSAYVAEVTWARDGGSMLQEVPVTLCFSVPSHLLVAVAAQSLIKFLGGNTALFPLTFAGGSVKRAVLKASFACGEEKSMLDVRGAAEVPRSPHSCQLRLPLLTSTEKISPEHPKSKSLVLGSVH